jgi:glycosyltransferase involved in cell wall biosynthesis
VTSRRLVLLVTNRPSAYRAEFFEALQRVGGLDWSFAFTQAHADSDVPTRLPAGDCWSSESRFTFLDVLARAWRVKPDIVVVGGAGVPTWAVMAYCRAIGRKMVVWWGGTNLSERDVSDAKSKSRRILFRQVDGFLSYGVESADYLRALGVPDDSVRVISNATLDIDRFRRQVVASRSNTDVLWKKLAHREGRPKGPVFVSVGRMVHSKNHLLLARAFNRVRAALEDAALVVVGDGPCKRELENMGVVVLPPQPWDAMPDVYALADAVVHPSLLDRWPQVASEALAAQLPLVASRTSGLGGFLVEERDAIFFDGTDVGEAAEAMIRLGGSEELRRRIGTAGADRLQAYGASKTAKMVEEFVLGLLGQTGAPGGITC